MHPVAEFWMHRMEQIWNREDMFCEEELSVELYIEIHQWTIRVDGYGCNLACGAESVLSPVVNRPVYLRCLAAVARCFPTPVHFIRADVLPHLRCRIFLPSRTASRCLRCRPRSACSLLSWGSKVETLVPRRRIEFPPEKLSCTTQPSMMRLMLLVPCPVSPAFSPGQVRSHSPTQKSNCFCCAVAHGFGKGVDVC